MKIGSPAMAPDPARAAKNSAVKSARARLTKSEVSAAL